MNWLIDDEIQLFNLICDYKPLGSMKKANIDTIVKKMDKFTQKQVWEKLNSLYDIEKLDNREIDEKRSDRKKVLKKGEKNKKEKEIKRGRPRKIVDKVEDRLSSSSSSSEEEVKRGRKRKLPSLPPPKRKLRKEEPKEIKQETETKEEKEETKEKEEKEEEKEKEDKETKRKTRSTKPVPPPTRKSTRKK